MAQHLREGRFTASHATEESTASRAHGVIIVNVPSQFFIPNSQTPWRIPLLGADGSVKGSIYLSLPSFKWADLSSSNLDRELEDDSLRIQEHFVGHISIHTISHIFCPISPPVWPF